MAGICPGREWTTAMTSEPEDLVVVGSSKESWLLMTAEVPEQKVWASGHGAVAVLAVVESLQDSTSRVSWKLVKQVGLVPTGLIGFEADRSLRVWPPDVAPKLAANLRSGLSRH